MLGVEYGSTFSNLYTQALLRFNEDPDIKVLLVSLKTGGVALNLTVANYVYIMDPWWNPAAEMQAIDRVHRIGQNKREDIEVAREKTISV